MIKKIVLTLPLIFGLLLYACSDDPSSVGLNLLDQDIPKFDTINSIDGSFTQTSSYFKKVVPLGASPRLLVGKSAELTAHTLLLQGFLLPDSIKNGFKEDSLTIDKAYIELFPNYLYPGSDSLANFDFTVQKILSSWSSSTFTADSFSVLQFDAADLSSNKEFGDSIYSFDIPLDFARGIIDFALNPDSVPYYGVLISPTASSQKIVGFNGFTPFQELDSRLKIIVSKAGEYTDTLTGFTASDISVVIGESPQPDPGYIILQSSVIINSRLYFDLSAIPENVSINRAVLTLYADSTKNVFGSQFDNAVIAYTVLNSETDSISTSLFARLEGSESKYSGNITSILKYWLLENRNYGMILRPDTEQNGLELFYIYGSEAADITKRPYLEIIYSYN